MCQPASLWLLCEAAFEWPVKCVKIHGHHCIEIIILHQFDIFYNLGKLFIISPQVLKIIEAVLQYRQLLNLYV